MTEPCWHFCIPGQHDWSHDVPESSSLDSPYFRVCPKHYGSRDIVRDIELSERSRFRYVVDESEDVEFPVVLDPELVEILLA